MVWTIIYARLGGAAPNLCFAGHTDVVPDRRCTAGWTVDPFGAEIRDGVMYGRGTSDMKGAIAAFVSASARYIADHGMTAGIDLAADHRRRGRPRPSRHAPPAARRHRRWRSARPLHRRRANVGRPHRRHREERTTRLAQRRAEGCRQARPCGLSGKIRQPDAGAARCAAEAARAEARQWQPGLPALEPRNHHDRRRQRLRTT